MRLPKHGGLKVIGHCPKKELIEIDINNKKIHINGCLYVLQNFNTIEQRTQARIDRAISLCIKQTIVYK